MFFSTPAPEKQTRYLSQAVQLEEAVNPSIIRSTMMAVSIAIIAFLGWAALTNINEVARTPGEVVPEGFQQVVQHLEGGIVRDIAVHEGEQVEKGQILLRLDGTDARDDLARALAKQVSLGLEEERLRAFSEGRRPNFSAYRAANPALVQDQTSFLDGMTRTRDGERSVISEQIRQKQQAIVSMQNDLTTAQRNYAITKDLYDRRQTLNQKGYVSDIQFLQTKQALNSNAGDIQALAGKIAVTRTEIGEFQSRLRSLDAKYSDDANERLAQVLADKAQTAQLVGQLQDRVARLDVRAPVRGLVKGLSVNTVGAVVQPGQTLMEIVPLDEKLVVQVKIPPQDIGHVRPGQTVQVKFSSFDFSRYGVVPGKLERVSPMTFTGENGERFYQGQIRLDRDYVGHDTANIIVPGMTVMAEIITGDKTVLEYLLKPIHLAMKTAFTER